jgi:hypothetical protein
MLCAAVRKRSSQATFGSLDKSITWNNIGAGTLVPLTD